MNAVRRASLGLAIWLIFSYWHVPHLLHAAWGEALLLFAALVILPFLLEIVGPEPSLTRLDDLGVRFLSRASALQFPAALLLVFSFGFLPGPLAAALAVPWTLVLLLLALTGAREIFSGGKFSLSRWCRVAGLIYAAVGAAWLMADRIGLRPLQFSEDIVLLTAVHFHYAGLLLPVLTGKTIAEFRPSLATTVIGMAVVVGVPAVAVGITTSQLRVGAGFEAIAALLMALGGAGTAVLQVILASQSRWPNAVRAWWLLASVSLLVGMLLASLYGLRSAMLPLPWLDLPWMRALHGTVNAVGFGGTATIAWYLVGRARVRAA